MRNILTIAGKDFRGYFSGPAFYVIGGLFTTFLSFTYFMLLRNFAQRSFQMMQMQMRGMGDGMNLHNEVIVGHISNVNLVLLILIPFITVRLFAEEKKMRTLDLLLTSPVTATEIVVGKFLAAFGAVWMLILVSLVYPISTAFFAPMQWGSMFSAYAGLLLIGAMYVAVGVFSSSLTESVILAGFIAIILSLCLWFVSWGSVVVEDPNWTTILNHISVSNHFGQFVRGSIQLVGLTFCLSVIAIYCFLTQRVVESARWR